jgi:signal transduction histidine kinase
VAESEGIKNPHFDVSAAVIRQLGAELISDEVTAVMELIKNSYDADADWVRINITTGNVSDPKHFFQNVAGSIVIEDNGFGMDETDIKDGWLIISVSKKRTDKKIGKTTPAGRTPLGDKGVGRLSVQRLGNKFEMITGKKRKNHFNKIAFDWSDFSDDIPLSKVKIHSSIIQKSFNKEGTTLIISDLIDPNKWDGGAWNIFRGHLSQLIFPYKDKRVFDIYLNKNGEPYDFDILNESLRNVAASEHTFNFNGSVLTILSTVSFDKLSGNTKDQEFIEEYVVADKGKDFFNFLTDKVSNPKRFISGAKYNGKNGQLFQVEKIIDLNSIPELIYVDDNENEIDDTSGNIDRKFAQPGQFTGEIRDYYFRETDNINSTFDSLGEFKKIVQNQAGIRIFREGFGLRPYGLDGNDWLKLGGSQTSGSSFYGLRPGNVIGFISIGSKSNQNLKEKTDREGFVTSPYSRNFFLLTDKIRDEINVTLEQARRSLNEYKNRKTAEKQGISSIQDSMTQLKATSSTAINLEKSTKNLGKEIKEVGVLLNNQYVKIQALKNLDKKLFEGSKNFLDHINDLFKKATKSLEDIETLLIGAQQLDGHVKYLEPLIKDLQNQLNDFSQLAGLGLTAEALSHELSNIIDRITQQTDRAVMEYNREPKNANQILLLLVENVKSTVKSFRKQLSHLAPSLKYVRENKESFSIHNFFEELVQFYNDRFENSIEVDLKLNGSDFNIIANKGRVTQIIDNLFLNSEYWLKEKMKAEKGFKPAIRVKIQEPFVTISDNGYGIDPIIEDRVFQPFVTAKPRNIGRGLGLYITQQLMESMGCVIILATKRNDNNRRFIFQLDFSKILKS